jgi:hypothetical protein
MLPWRLRTLQVPATEPYGKAAARVADLQGPAYSLPPASASVHLSRRNLIINVHFKLGMYSLCIFVRSLTLVVRITTTVVLKHRYEMSALAGENGSISVCVFHNKHMELFFLYFPSFFQCFHLLYKFTVSL